MENNMEWVGLFVILIITWAVKVMPWWMSGYVIFVAIIMAMVAVAGMPLWFKIYDRMRGGCHERTS
jgi:membrane protein YdbS with pleckstrin-like domain